MNVMRNLIFAGLIGLNVAATAVDAKPRNREQDEAFRGTHDGRLVPLRVIESRVIPQMRGFDYLGPEIYLDSGFYRLKFMRGGQVVWIDVDAASGHIIRKSGF